MPLFDYTCPRGHVHELVRPLGTEGVPCPTCGQAATRSHVHRFDVRGPTVDTRGMFRRFNEATHELDHAATRIEANTGAPVATPSYYRMARARANAMIAAGEAPVLRGKD